MEPQKKLYRIKKGRIIAGVSTGFAEYFNIDVVIVRVVFVALTFAGGSGVLLYIVLALIIPEEPGTEGGGTAHSSSHAESHAEPIKEFVENVQDNAQKIAQDIKQREPDFGNARNLIGMVVIAVGVLALFNSVTGFHIFRWDLFWPVILIFVGAFLVFRKK